ncbi:hypothetical protein HHK36_028591 [Tetracentron sinense]|uniref:Uncharacterized protein n=1 Tax=Tetracentron sinense TaxID=13715 RepID=A0A835D0D3_TETSI|nr:hypothetical protein HHK36_028591 [Tetracentron sinense]
MGFQLLCDDLQTLEGLKLFFFFGSSSSKQTRVNWVKDSETLRKEKKIRGTKIQQYPRALSSQSASGASESMEPITPAKGDVSKAFPLQYGTISPGFMNGMQARHDLFRAVPILPIPFPKQQQPKKDIGIGITPQFWFGGLRKAVKITHPETHEVLTFDRTYLYLDGGSSGQISHPVPTSFSSDTASKHGGKGAEKTSCSSIPIPLSGSKDKLTLEANKAKKSISRAKKKRREILQKADAAGKTSELYMAYKGPEEKQETAISSESKGGTSRINVKQVPADGIVKDGVASEGDGQGKAEPGDWEDSAEISSPKLKTSNSGKQICGGLVHHDEDVINAMGKKKYSRDFLLAILEQCTDLSAGFFSKDKPTLELNKAKNSTSRGKNKKKRKEILQKADAAGTTSDPYMVYKGPEEKQITAIFPVCKDGTLSINVKQVPADGTVKYGVASGGDGQSKAEPDDWEDAAEICSPKLTTSNNGEQICCGLVQHDEDVIGAMGKQKYSRDFLLTILEQYTDLPADFFTKDKPTLEPNRAKKSASRGKKKIKEILQKADAARTTSDPYLAYKGPEEKQETAISSESKDGTSSINVKQVPADGTVKDGVASEGDEQSFDFTSDIVETLMVAKDSILHFADRESYPSFGRIVDRPTGGSRPDRRGSGMMDDDKWSKLPSGFASGWDLRQVIGLGGTVSGFRPGQGGNRGMLRNPRGQTPGQYVGGILSGPMQSVASHGGMQRNSPDADRWQHATGTQKGLLPYPQTPLQAMHKAEKKCEVGKVSDKEEAK